MVKTGEVFLLRWDCRRCGDILGAVTVTIHQPRDREVVCLRGGTWTQEDLRIKMCIKVIRRFVVTITSAKFYQRAYTAAALTLSGAHDGFHEAIGDSSRCRSRPITWSKSDCSILQGAERRQDIGLCYDREVRWLFALRLLVDNGGGRFLAAPPAGDFRRVTLCPAVSGGRPPGGAADDSL